MLLVAQWLCHQEPSNQRGGTDLCHKLIHSVMCSQIDVEELRSFDCMQDLMTRASTRAPHCDGRAAASRGRCVWTVELGGPHVQRSRGGRAQSPQRRPATADRMLGHLEQPPQEAEAAVVGAEANSTSRNQHTDAGSTTQPTSTLPSFLPSTHPTRTPWTPKAQVPTRTGRIGSRCALEQHHAVDTCIEASSTGTRIISFYSTTHLSLRHTGGDHCRQPRRQRVHRHQDEGEEDLHPTAERRARGAALDH
nr:uncharacterized protein LOC117836287 [Setaria viridis]